MQAHRRGLRPLGGWGVNGRWPFGRGLSNARTVRFRHARGHCRFSWVWDIWLCVHSPSCMWPAGALARDQNTTMRSVAALAADNCRKLIDDRFPGRVAADCRLWWDIPARPPLITPSNPTNTCRPRLTSRAFFGYLRPDTAADCDSSLILSGDRHLISVSVTYRPRLSSP